MHQNVSLGSNGVDRVRLLRKIPTRLRGTNLCTSSAHFAPSFVRQPNGPEGTKIVRNAPKRKFRVQWGGSGAFVAKNSDATSWHELVLSSSRFAPSFVRQPNGPECTQIVRHTPKQQFRVQWGGSGVFVAKNYDATSWHELLHLFGPFCSEFRKAIKRFRMHPNSMKRTKTSILGLMGWIGCIRCEKIRCDFVSRTFELVRPVLHRVSYGNQTVPNAPK